MKDFVIYITFDIDQDFSLDTHDYYNRNHLEFEGLYRGMPQILDVLNGLPFSVFVRADYQIKKIYGRYDFLLHQYSELFHQITRANGDLCWHIHLYKEDGDNWGQIRNREEANERFRMDLEIVREIREVDSRIVRIGECMMNNLIMKSMNEYGVVIDSTALPQRARNDQEKYFDWMPTSNAWYHPSIADYRLAGKPSYDVLEVPMTTIPMQASYDKEAYPRYVNLSFKSDVLFQHMATYIQENDDLVTLTHPFEILSKGQHALIGYDIAVFKRNLHHLVDLVQKAGKNPVFKKMGEIAG